MDTQLTDDQAAVYDRQLRVWGVEVQRKLTAARVLIVGFGKLAAEVAKNITLAGVGQVTLLDDTPAEEHAGANFLITTPTAAQQTVAEAAAKTLQAMNPLVKVSAAPGSIDSAKSVDMLQQHDLVIASGLPLHQAAQLDLLCRRAGAGFMAAAAAGAAGWFFVDLGDHSYMPKGSSGDAGNKRELHYSTFDGALAPPQGPLPASTHGMYYVLNVCLALEQQLRRALTAADLPAAQQQLITLAGSSAQLPMAQQLLAAYVSGAAEFAPVCAVLGGVIANNVVAAVCGSGAPLDNMLYYSIIDGRAIVETQPADAAGSVAEKKMKGQQAANTAAANQQAAGDTLVID